MLPIFISRKDLKGVVGLSYPTVHRLEKDGKFPDRKQLTEGRVGWLYSEVLEWATSRSNSLFEMEPV